MTIKNILRVFCLMAVWFLPISLNAQSKAPINAKDLLDRIDDLWRGGSSKSKFTMQIKTKHWQRQLTMQSYSLGKDYSLISIEKPEKEKGTTTLKVKDDIWNYLPKVDRSIKIPPSMLLSAWMGSHFTNDDLVKESRMSEDYNYEITFTGARAGVEIYELTLIPKPNAPVVWGKVVVEVRQDNYMPVNEYYYDEKGVLARQAWFANYQIQDGKLIPLSMTIAPVQNGTPLNPLVNEAPEYTTVITEEIDFDIKINADFFSLQQLKRNR